MSLFYKTKYIIAMYSGIRALKNQFLSLRNSPVLQSKKLHQLQYKSEHFGEISLSINSRSTNPAQLKQGMISIKLKRPVMNKLMYLYFTLTSHFGNGHIELAFYEKQNNIYIYAIRNIAQANAFRLKLRLTTKKLKFGNRNWKSNLLIEISEKYKQHNLILQLCTDTKSINLALDPKLIKPNKYKKTSQLIARKHLLLQQKISGNLFTKKNSSFLKDKENACNKS